MEFDISVKFQVNHSKLRAYIVCITKLCKNILDLTKQKDNKCLGCRFGLRLFQIKAN